MAFFVDFNMPDCAKKKKKKKRVHFIKGLPRDQTVACLKVILEFLGKTRKCS